MKGKKMMLAMLSGALALVLSLSAVGQITPPVAVAAQSSGQIQAQIDEVEAEREEVQKQMAALNRDLEANLDELERISAEKNVIDQEIGLLNQEILLINEQITAYGLLIADKQDELDAAQARVDELTEQNKQRIRTMEEDGNLSYWSVLFRANDFADLLDRLNMIEEIAAADRRRLEELRQAHEAVRVAQEELTVQKAALEETRLDLEENQTLLAQKRVEADAKLTELNARKEEYMEMLDAAEDADYQLMLEIAQLEKEYNAAKAAEQAALAPPPGTGNTGAGSTDFKPPASVTDGITWLMPCAYTRLSSPFGWRIHPVYGYPKFHAGVDLSNVSGTPLYATRSGVVNIAMYSDSAGYYVSVNHGDGFSSVYMHMTHFVVSYGQQVAAGQLLGYMGSTGVSTGPHLHFGISYNGTYVNPADYLNFR